MLDLIIGIDIGMSGTSVAYQNVLRHGLRPSPLSVIPASDTDSAIIKIPTTLYYDKNNIGVGPIGWGFDTDPRQAQEKDLYCGQWFKLGLTTSGSLDDQNDHVEQPGLVKPETLYKHFLAKLYKRIQAYMSEHELNDGPCSKTWAPASINFLFSYPATWGEAESAAFKEAISSAGFTQHDKHTIHLNISEPEASACFALASQHDVLKTRKTMLIIDAGSATTDLCLIKIKKKDGRISLKSMAPVCGTTCGSTYIDLDFQDFAQKRLESLDQQLLTQSPEYHAWQMMMSDFQDIKHTFGKAGQDEVFLINDPDLDNPIAQGAQVTLRKRDLGIMFDGQIDRIGSLIDGVISDNRELFEETDCVLFSGGLGSSKYVQQEIAAIYKRRCPGLLREALFLQSDEPQLCVSKGLVYNKIKALKSGEDLEMYLSYSASIGIQRVRLRDVGEMRPDRCSSEQHTIENIVPASGDIEWIVRKGQRQLLDLVNTSHSQWFPSNTPLDKLVGMVAIVQSDLTTPPSQLPHESVKECELLPCDFRSIPGQNVSTHWHSWKRYKKVDYVIEAKIDEEGVKLVCKNPGTNQRLSREIRIPIRLEVNREGAVFGTRSNASRKSLVDQIRKILSRSFRN